MHNGSRHRRDTSPGAVWVATLLSALLHLPVLLVLGAMQPDEEVLTSTNFDAESAFSIQVVEDEEEAQQTEDEEEEQLQHVSFEAPEREERPEVAKFADQYDSKAEEEMARKALPGPVEPVPPPPQPQPVEPSETQESDGETGEESEPEQAEPREDDVADGVNVKEEQAEAPKSKSGAEKLFPSLHDDRAAEMLGQGGSVDYLRDVPEGDKTLLNRKRTRYWAFFDRVKRQVSKQWSPVTEYRKRDPYGNVYGVKDRYSTVDVTLNGDGTVRRLFLSRASGLEFFDDEAVRAIKSAAPYHNPPEGLKDEDGLVHFTFGFYFEISSGQFRFMRIGN